MRYLTPDWRSRLDTLANVVTIAACVLLASLVVLNTVESRKAAREALSALPDLFPAGTMLKADDDLVSSERGLTLLLGLRTTCRYCDESMPALRRLNSRVQRSEGRVSGVAISVEPADLLADYLGRNGLSGFTPMTVRRDSDLGRAAALTPSIVLLDQDGVVLRTWPGLVTRDRLQEVLAYLDAPHLSNGVTPTRGR